MLAVAERMPQSIVGFLTAIFLVEAWLQYSMASQPTRGTRIPVRSKVRIFGLSKGNILGGGVYTLGG